MAIPSSGELSLSEIFAELYANDYGGWSNYQDDGYSPSLLNLSTGGDPPDEAINTNNDAADRPDGSTPHAMSEFYSYDHSATAPLAGDYGNGANNILWSGNQSTTLQTDSVDISGANWCGSSAIGETGHIYFRIVSTNGYKQDAQIVAVNQSGYGWNNIGKTTGGWGYANWYGTRKTTNTAYNHSTGWYAIAAGSTAGRWNRDTGNTPSSNTGVDVDNFSSDGCIYYEGSSGGYNYDVYLRSPSFTFNTNTIGIKSYGNGANMGTLYMGVYIT